MTRDAAPDGDGEGYLRRSPAAHTLAPIVHLDFIDPVHRPRADPTDVFDPRVRHVGLAIPSPRVVDSATRWGGRSLEAQRVAQRTRDVEIDVGACVPGCCDLHESRAIPTAIVDHAVAIVIDGIARLFHRMGAIAWNLFYRCARHDRDEDRWLDDGGHFVSGRDLRSHFIAGFIGACPGTREGEHQTGDGDSSHHRQATIVEVAYNADAMMEALEQAKQAVADQTGCVDVAMVLGSGLGDYANAFEDAHAIPYGKIPHMPLSSVSGHAGNLVAGNKAGKRIVAMQGRTHLYEGRSAADVAFGVRLMAVLGAKALIVTNAAGGIAPELEAGDLMAITDQLNLTGTSSLVGPNVDRQGPRFLDMTTAFDPDLIETADEVASALGFGLKRGVYAGLLGPAYETPAEVRMLRTLGADAVGMSTVLEVLAARHMGLRVLGISCISNLAAGISKEPLSHQEVQETAGRVGARFASLLSGVLESM